MAIGTTNFPASLDTATELIRAANDARGVIATGGASNSATTINITSVPSAAPADGIAVIVSATDDSIREIVSYTGKTSTTITGVTRGLESSGAKTWAAGAIVYFDVLTALSRTVLVNALIALETFALSSDGVRVVAYNGASVTSTNSGTTYATYLTTTAILPAGTWECTTMCFGVFGSGTVNAWFDVRVSAPAAGSGTIDGIGQMWAHVSASAQSQGNVVSDGSTPTTFTSQFRWNNSGVAASITAFAGMLVAVCRRVA